MDVQCKKHLFIIPLTNLHGDEDGRVACARCGLVKPAEPDFIYNTTFGDYSSTTGEIKNATIRV